MQTKQNPLSEEEIEYMMEIVQGIADLAVRRGWSPKRLIHGCMFILERLEPAVAHDDIYATAPKDAN